MKKSTLAIVTTVVVAAAAAGWNLSHRSAEPVKPAGPGPQGPTTVAITTAKRQDVPVVLQANGTVTPLSTVDLHAQITSTIARVHIKEGQFVKAGDLMFTLDERSARANLDKAQAQVVRDQAALADVERQYQRAQDLLAQKFIAQSAVDTLKSQVESARALLNADRAAARSSGVDASYNTIRAPMAGRVGAINVYPGSLVQLATSLTTITQLDPITVAFTLPESALGSLLQAQRAGSVAVKAISAEGAQEVDGALSFIDNTVDPVAGVIRVKAQFSNRDTRLWPGQYVSTRLVAQVLKDVLVIPQNAIISNTRGTFVYTVDAEQKAKVVNIQRLHSFGESVAVSGLDGSEKIIVDGKQNLRPGGKVRVAGAGQSSDQQKG